MVVLRWWAQDATSRKHYLTRLEHIVTPAQRVCEKRHAGRGERRGALCLEGSGVALREDVELEAVRHAQLVVDAAQVISQRVLADVQAARERLVVGARLLHQAAHDVVLAIGERGDGGL